jgi:hypothetical protein
MCNQVRGFHRHGRTQRGGEEENYIFDFYNVTINYNLDIWDFFRHLGLTAPPPLVKNPAYGPVHRGIFGNHCQDSNDFSKLC